ncbi:MAG: flavodoxin family protein [Oscillospiraceae bacterium]
MKILMLNGSPRLNGNTKTALNAIAEGFGKNVQNEVEIIDVCQKNIKGCVACESCKFNGGKCVLGDDSVDIMEKIYECDVLILGTPVYWWGMSGQLKLLVDKFYSKALPFHKQDKKVGIVAVGASGVDDIQYNLISQQFACIFKSLKWQIVFDEAASAFEIGELSKSQQAIEKFSELWKKF